MVHALGRLSAIARGRSEFLLEPLSQTAVSPKRSLRPQSGRSLRPQPAAVGPQPDRRAVWPQSQAAVSGRSQAAVRPQSGRSQTAVSAKRTHL